MVEWRDEGVGIGKYRKAEGDIWRGWVVVDKEKRAGLGKNGVVGIVREP